MSRFSEIELKLREMLDRGEFSEWDAPSQGAEVVSPASLAPQTPPKKKRVSKKRNFGLYSYRGRRFIFTYLDATKAIVSFMDTATNKIREGVTVAKSDVYKVARALVRINELENSIKKSAKQVG